FQAEDGIRYWSVTGVQTCALPISHRKRNSASPVRPSVTTSDEVWKSASRSRASSSLSPVSTSRPRGPPGTVWTISSGRPLASRRSEERRVGKEGRAQGAPYESEEN